MSRVILFLLILTITPAIALAQSASLRGATPVDLQQKVLGPGCHLIPSSGSGLSCNPAQLPESADRRFVANLFIGENFQRVNAYRKDLENKDELAVVNKLLEEKEPLQMDGGTSLWVRSSWFSVVYNPIQLSFYTDVQNRSYPIVDMKILLEKSLRLQGAHQWIWSDWRLNAGLQARGVQRKSVFQTLALFDVLADPELLQINEHESIFLEPAVTLGHNSSLNPRISVFFQNLNVYHSGADAPQELSKALFDTGFALTPYQSQTLGRWDLGLNYRFDQMLAEDWERLRLVTSYSLGVMTANGSLSQDSWSLGVSTSFLSAKTGVSFTQSETPEWNGSSSQHQTVNLEFGLVF